MNSAKVSLCADAFKNTLISGTFQQIHDLDLQANVFANISGYSKLRIQQCSLKTLPALNALFDSVKFIDSNITEIQSNAFGVKSIEISKYINNQTDNSSIIFEKCQVETIQENAFTRGVRLFRFFIDLHAFKKKITAFLYPCPDSLTFQQS